MQLPDQRFIRFLIAGVINTLFGFLVYSALILGGNTRWQALLLGSIAGVCFNFFTTGGYAFRDISARRIPRFALSYLAVYLINLALVEIAAHFRIQAILTQGVLMFPMAGLSYFLMSNFVFPSPDRK